MTLLTLAEQSLVECGICDCWHPQDFSGDCRDDSNRFGAPEDLADLWAAAPKLLGACKSALRALQENLAPGPMDGEQIANELDAITGLLAAIEKATA